MKLKNNRIWFEGLTLLLIPFPILLGYQWLTHGFSILFGLVSLVYLGILYLHFGYLYRPKGLLLFGRDTLKLQQRGKILHELSYQDITFRVYPSHPLKGIHVQVVSNEPMETNYVFGPFIFDTQTSKVFDLYLPNETQLNLLVCFLVGVIPNFEERIQGIKITLENHEIEALRLKAQKFLNRL